MAGVEELVVAICAFIAGAFFLYWLLRPVRGSSNVRDVSTPLGAYKKKSWEEATRDCPKTGEKYLVIGAGFLGKRLVQALLDRGEDHIRVFDIAPSPFPDNERIEYMRGDVTKLDALSKACEGIETVYSTFAILSFAQRLPHQADLSERINVGGTENVIQACKKNGVQHLIYTSTANVATAPGSCHDGMTEEDPYIPREASHNHYTWTKAEAEQRVRGANEKDGLHTVCVRPCSGVFGHGDKMMMQKAIVDKMVVLVCPTARIDYVYVDNVVLGHLLAEARLRSGTNGVAGEAFCVSNDEPVTSEELYSIVRHYKPEVKLVYAPINLIRGLAGVVEMISWLTKDGLYLGEDLKQLTPAMITTADLAYTYNCEKARRILGYRPLYTIDEAVQKTIDEYHAYSMKKMQ